MIKGRQARAMIGLYMEDDYLWHVQNSISAQEAWKAPLKKVMKYEACKRLWYGNSY